jgi:hypothetical protein
MSSSARGEVAVRTASGWMAIWKFFPSIALGAVATTAGSYATNVLTGGGPSCGGRLGRLGGCFRHRGTVGIPHTDLVERYNFNTSGTCAESDCR